jgi:hypothetical protein
MDEGCVALLRRLMSEIEGAPFPGSPEPELYAIWYEHAQRSAQEALEFLAELDPLYGRDIDYPPEFR